MGARVRSWWQQIRKHPVASVLIALLAVVIVLFIFGGYKFNWDWTGFNHPSKTLWDWLQLLGVLAVPVVVGFGAVWFTTKQGKVADAENKDNQRETALQAYIDKMSELLLYEKLRDSTEEDEVRNIARVRTLTILLRLDADRKRSVLKFLHESSLIQKDKKIIDLRGADLHGADLHGASLYKSDFSGAFFYEADLHGANLRGADLLEADLHGANLHGAFLYGADLHGANLRGADLSGADLSGANLKSTKVTNEKLDQAKSLKGATMSDGSKHP